MAPARLRNRLSGRTRSMREPVDLAPGVPAVDASSDRCAYGPRSDSFCDRCWRCSEAEVNESLRTTAFCRSRLAAKASLSAATIAASSSIASLEGLLSLSFGAAPKVLDTDVAPVCGECWDAATWAVGGAAWATAGENCAVAVTGAGWAADGVVVLVVVASSDDGSMLGH